MSRPITTRDIAEAAMGGAGLQTVRFSRVPPTRPEQCPGCPFGAEAGSFLALKCQVLKDALAAKPAAVWMCHETTQGGVAPTEKSILCRGFVDWRAEQTKEG